ncbi:variant surface glycoprotein (VSG, atypical), putative [Trypanosoma equiperdum]|uniref:Variant surface glycoprotein (VSG, atypical), putative n=1 Tax=Trypanosoma equiperdum TaxID=5694 RepID=A0A1G4IJM2_TRYEQ|nr:variant surface glycoprotein (VSG, atypical), putative [Trypanosoma equiperdum]
MTKSKTSFKQALIATEKFRKLDKPSGANAKLHNGPKCFFTEIKMVMRVTPYFLPLMALLITPLCEAATKGAQAPFHSLCLACDVTQNMKLPARSPMPAPPSYDRLLKLKMSVAPADWRKMFEKDEAKQWWDKYREANSDSTKGLDWSKHWSRWLTAAEAVNNQKSDLNAKDKPKHNNSLKDYQISTINMSAQEAQNLLEQLNTEPQDSSGKSLANAVNDELGKAFCSDTLTGAAQSPVCSDISNWKSKVAQCTTANAGKSIALDMFCLCAVTNDQDSCAGGTNIAGTVLDTDNPHANALQTLIGKCPKSGLESGLDEGITLALAAFLGKLGQLEDNQNKIGIGRTVDGNVCTGTSRACFKYTDQIKDGTKGVKQIAWIGHLLTAKKLFSEYKQQAAHKHLFIKDIDNLSKQAEHEYDCKQALEPTSGPPRAGTLGKGEQLSTEQECDKHHARPDNCTKAECTYNAKN